MKHPTSTRTEKLRRIRAGNAPRLLELCSGCGGLSLGFAAAGYSLVAHVESDPVAAMTYALNFRPPTEVRSEEWASPRDMEKELPQRLFDKLGITAPLDEAVDVIAAGLPCQAFARIGRSKLRSIANEEDAYRYDSRAKLYKRFLRYVEVVQPVAVVIENVPDILNFGGHNVPEEICEALEKSGYETRYTLLNAAYYGVPQMRERLFLIAIDRSLGIPSIPEPSHHCILPSGYEGARSFALKHVLPSVSRFSLAPSVASTLQSSISTRDALADLPYISEHWRDPDTMRRRKVADALPYRTDAELSSYARLMRHWPGFETGGTVTGNVVRVTPRDFATFRAMRSRDDYPRALRIAEEIFERRLSVHPVRPRKGSAKWTELRSASVPPYDPSKFPNKWWKLDPALPSRTLTAHMGKDSYSHIHWDSRQQRTISVREAARLQSFPDGFLFAGAMNAAFRQIGNAVPPLLAHAIASCLKRDLLRSQPVPLRPRAMEEPDGLRTAVLSM